MKRLILFACCLLLTVNCFAQGSNSRIFTNPILSTGADPWVIYKDGYYFYTQTMGNRLELWKTANMAGLNNAAHITIWKPPVGKPFSKDIWAPELHFLQGKWYMYFAADDGKNKNHRLYVLENLSPDPMQGNWLLKGSVSDITHKWAIDASVFENKGKLYLIWSGWEGNVNGEQDIYIAQMGNPYTVTSKRVKISSPVYQWEKYGDLHDASNPPHVNVNEGPEMLKHGNRLFLVYSASGCWTDHYALGMISASASANLLDPASWVKTKTPVFKESEQNSVYAPGHNAFFKSPDGKQDWLLYHANPNSGCGCDGQRSPRMQQFTWKKDGTPDFGVPVREGISLSVPK